MPLVMAFIAAMIAQAKGRSHGNRDMKEAFGGCSHCNLDDGLSSCLIKDGAHQLPRCEFALVHRLEQVSVSIAFEQQMDGM
jgi:hypothetical protein